MFLFETPQGTFVAIFLVVIMTTFISWLLFARMSMARIERQMREDGLAQQAPWDGVGLRVLWYASAIAFPVGIFNPANDPLIDVPTVRRYATQKDRLLGWALMVSGFFSIVLVFLGGPVFGFY